MRYFCSDLHFAHNKPFLFEPRGFTSWEEHAETVVSNINRIVKPEDELLILGDCILSDDVAGMNYLRQLNGHKFLAIGNHDTNKRIAQYKTENIFEDIQYGYRFDYNKMTFWCQHYPCRMGNYKDKHPTIALTGHTHSPDKFQYMEDGDYNVALDAHNCRPISIEEIFSDIKEYRKTHPIVEYPDRSPYCAYCKNKESCIARSGHELPCPGYAKE